MTTRRHLPGLAVLSLFLLFAGHSTPIQAAITNPRRIQRPAVVNERQQARDSKEALRQEAQAGDLTAFSNLAKLHAARLETRFKFYQTRLAGIHARLGERLSLTESQYGEGVVSSAQSAWHQAQSKLEESQSLSSRSIALLLDLPGDSLTAKKSSARQAATLINQSLSALRLANTLMQSSTRALRRLPAYLPSARPLATSVPAPLKISPPDPRTGPPNPAVDNPTQ